MFCWFSWHCHLTCHLKVIWCHKENHIWMESRLSCESWNEETNLDKGWAITIHLQGFQFHSKGVKWRGRSIFVSLCFFHISYINIYLHIIKIFLAHMKSTRGRLCSQKPFITPLPYGLSWFGSMCSETRNSHRTWGLSLDRKHSGRVASFRRVIVLGVTTKFSHTKRIYLAKTT